jgi:hypothetical protein
MSIVLGKTYQDRITGFKGVATGYVQYITGCNQTLLAPRVDDNGGMRDSQWFDEQRCELIDSDQITLDNSASPGPDKMAPRR